MTHIVHDLITSPGPMLQSLILSKELRLTWHDYTNRNGYNELEPPSLYLFIPSYGAVTELARCRICLHLRGNLIRAALFARELAGQ